MANIQLSVDLGSKFITICQKGVGLVLREPCIAIAQKTKDRLEIREAGFRAESIISTSLGGAKVVAPPLFALSQALLDGRTLCSI